MFKFAIEESVNDTESNIQISPTRVPVTLKVPIDAVVTASEFILPTGTLIDDILIDPILAYVDTKLPIVVDGAFIPEIRDNCPILANELYKFDIVARLTFKSDATTIF